MGYFTETLGIPYAFGLLAITAEFVGGLALLFGLLTRVAAFGIGTTMMVAALTVHAEFGFFMNWFGSQEGEGVEFFLLAIGIALALLIGGGGRWSADRVLARDRRSTPSPRPANPALRQQYQRPARRHVARGQADKVESRGQAK